MSFLFTVSLASVADDYPVELEVVSPIPPKTKGKKGRESQTILFRAGGLLSFKVSMGWEDIEGISIALPIDQNDILGNEYPEPGRPGGVVVLEDPNNNWSLGCLTDLLVGASLLPEYCDESPNREFDETVLAFFPDRGDQIGVACGDRTWTLGQGMTGHCGTATALPQDDGFTLQLEQLSSPDNRPRFGGPQLAGSWDPDLSGWQAVPDGVGYGADDNAPFLVLLSDTGVGVVLDVDKDFEIHPGDSEYLSPIVPATRRNLAGFFSIVGYEGKDNRGRLSITASMVIPRHLFTDVELVDACLGEVGHDPSGIPASCSGYVGSDEKVRRVYLPDGQAGSNETDVTVRAFVVAPLWGNGQFVYPDVIIDSDGDGTVDAADAELMGFAVLSKEVELRFRQIETNTVEYPARQSGEDQGSTVFFDLDRNGVSALDAFSSPGGGGGIRRF